jgi:hypothetical protein
MGTTTNHIKTSAMGVKYTHRAYAQHDFIEIVEEEIFSKKLE